MRYNSPSLISRCKKKSQIMSATWINCKKRVEDRVTPTSLACWFPQLRLLDTIATKYSPMQDSLTSWPSGWRVFGVHLSRWSHTKNMVFIDIDDNWYKYGLIFQPRRSTSTRTDITPRDLPQAPRGRWHGLEGNWEIGKGDMGSSCLVLVRKNLILLQTRYV